jgi:cyclophilin family peptidyl-prolyl cis-trans isomerase
MADRHALIETNHGSITIELFEELAPRTTGNFIELGERGFYDGVIFHRIIDGFMLQGGDPSGTGRGGPGHKIPDEFGAGLSHSGEGILSMANAGPDTGGSQFFITLAATPWLDGKHAIFGRVVEGIEVVRALGKIPTDGSDKPLDDVVMESVRITGGDAAAG